MFHIYPSRCTECQICMQICSWEHLEANNPKRARIWVEAEWPEEPSILVCLACEDHECVQACPAGALDWDGWIRLDRARCDSCGRCVEACPVGGIRQDPADGFPLICDTCEGGFQCVHWCPTRAIEKIGL